MEALDLRIHQDAPIPLDVAVDCAPGEVLALLGPSGSGKTTVLRSVAGTYRPTHGRIRVAGETWFDAGESVCLPAHRRGVGMVFQSYALFPHMNALENVMAAMGHVARDRRRSTATELLALVNLSGLEGRRPKQLSGGQQQRVAVARALAREPKVLLLDEPFSAVDKATRQRLYREIAELRRVLSMPVVLVTHDLEEATLLADRIAILHHGRVLQHAKPEEITVRPASVEVARLLNLRNIFNGRVIEHVPNRNMTLLEWKDCRLEAPLNRAWACGSRVMWVVPDGFVILHRRDRPSRGEHENPVPGTVESVVAIGQAAHITLRPRHDPDLPIHFSVPLHVAHRNGVVDGVDATVSLLAEGIHIMPPDDDKSFLGVSS